MVELFSYGGGRQGIAICALIIQGKLPKPDTIVIADTGREKSSTWRYMEDVTRPALARIGLDINIASHDLATVDLHSKKGKLLIPVFTAGGGKLQTFCSVEWKRRVVQRWYRNEYGHQTANVWIGFATDEIHRVNQPDSDKWRHWYPLIEHVKLSTADCFSAIAEMGWPTPPRSSCWMCPHMSDQEWLELPADEFEKAAKLEKDERIIDHGVFLHREMRPISDVNMRSQRDLFDSGCNSGYCFT